MKNKKTKKLIINTIIGTALFAAAFYLAGWKICLAVFLMMWANNMTTVAHKFNGRI